MGMKSFWYIYIYRSVVLNVRTVTRSGHPTNRHVNNALIWTVAQSISRIAVGNATASASLKVRSVLVNSLQWSLTLVLYEYLVPVQLQQPYTTASTQVKGRPANLIVTFMAHILLLKLITHPRTDHVCCFLTVMILRDILLHL